jgi:hypothetical protein
VKTLLHFFVAFCTATVPLLAAEWQWSVPMGAGRAFLWIPPDCARVRAVIVGQNNMLEEGILEHTAMRRTLASLGIAEVFVAPPFDNVFQFDRGAGERFDAMMRALADESGYDELATAPVGPIGHSACASYPWNFAAWNPGRTLAVLSIKGDAPQTDLTGSGKPNPDWGARTIDGVPGLMVMSEVEWWDARLTPLLKFRAAHPAAPIGLLADVGRSHFDSSDALIEFLALFIRKAAAARLPQNDGGALRPIDPARGWLVDRWRGDEPLRAPAASAAAYTGDRADALWCFDEETARATEAYYARMRGKKTQQVDFVQAGQFAPISTSHAGVELKFLPLEDGITFRLGADFIGPLPPKPPVAAKDKPPPPTVVTPSAATPGTHAAGPVRVTRITGSVAQIDNDTWRIALNRISSTTDRRGADIWLLAEHPGDETHKSALQQAVLRAAANTIGGEQRITFPEIPHQKAGGPSLQLHATSDAGVPVSYYVREGPAEIAGDTLRFTAIPPRAKFPVKVIVVAWQFGCVSEPKLKAAEKVERMFLIVK